MQHGMKLDIFYAKNNSILSKYLTIIYNREVRVTTTLIYGMWENGTFQSWS
jgi:hypothetical protein